MRVKKQRVKKQRVQKTARQKTARLLIIVYLNFFQNLSHSFSIVKTEFLNCIEKVKMIFENVYIQFYILHITYKLSLPFGGAEEGQKNSKNLQINMGKMNF